MGLKLLRADESGATRGQTRTSWTQINGVSSRATYRRREEQLSKEADDSSPTTKLQSSARHPVASVCAS